MQKTLSLLLIVFALFSFNKMNAQANAGPNQNICEDYTFMEAVNPTPNTGQWIVISGTGTFVDMTLYNSELTNIGQGLNVFRWELTIGSNTYTDDVEITVHPVPTVNVEIRPDEPLRIPNAIFSFQNMSDTDLVAYEWDFGNGDNRHDFEFVGAFDYEYNVAGTYVISLEGTSSGACNGFFQDTVVVLAACPQSWNEGALIAEGCQELTIEFYTDVEYADDPMFTKWNFYHPNDDVPSNVNRDSSTYVNNPVYEYTEAGVFHPYITAWNEACGTEDIPHYSRVDTVIVYKKPIVDIDVSPKRIIAPGLISCFNYSEYGDRFFWDFGDDTISAHNFQEYPQHLYTEPGVYDVTLSVWSVNDCYASDTIYSAVYVEENSDKIDFTIYPNPSFRFYYVRTKVDLIGAVFDITDISGKEVNADIIHFSDNFIVLDLKNNSGIYFLRIKNDDSEFVYKLMKY